MKFLLSSQDIQNYKFIWNISKENYVKQKSSMLLMFLLVLFSAFFTTLLPYLLKIIIDYSAHEYNFLLDIQFPFNFLYFIVLAYAIAWLANELCNWTKNIFSAYLMVDFKGALIFAGLKNYLNLKKEEQDQIEAGAVISDLTRGSSAFGEVNLTLLLHVGPIIFQLVMIFAVLLTGNGFKQISLSFGQLLTVLGAIAIALEIIFISYFAGKVNLRRVTIIQLGVASLLSFAIMPIVGEHTIPAFSWPLVLIAVALGLASALIQFVMNWAQRVVDPSRAAIIYAGEPVWAGIIGRIAGERLPVIALFGGALVVLGVLVSELKIKLPIKKNKRVRE